MDQNLMINFLYTILGYITSKIVVFHKIVFMFNFKKLDTIVTVAIKFDDHLLKYCFTLTILHHVTVV